MGSELGLVGPVSYRNLNIGTLVATLPGAWRSTVSAGTGRAGVIQGLEHLYSIGYSACCEDCVARCHTRTFSVMLGSLLCVLGSCERHL